MAQVEGSNYAQALGRLETGLHPYPPLHNQEPSFDPSELKVGDVVQCTLEAGGTGKIIYSTGSGGVITTRELLINPGDIGVVVVAPDSSPWSTGYIPTCEVTMLRIGETIQMALYTLRRWRKL